MCDRALHLVPINICFLLVHRKKPLFFNRGQLSVNAGFKAHRIVYLETLAAYYVYEGPKSWYKMFTGKSLSGHDFKLLQVLVSDEKRFIGKDIKDN